MNNYNIENIKSMSSVIYNGIMASICEQCNHVIALAKIENTIRTSDPSAASLADAINKIAILAINLREKGLILATNASNSINIFANSIIASEMATAKTQSEVSTNLNSLVTELDSIDF